MATGVTSVLTNKGVKWICGGWVAFIGENLVLSQNREAIISRFGDQNYHLAYSGLSTLACTSIAYGYIWHGRRQGPRLFSGVVPVAIRLVGLGFQGMGLVLASQMSPALRSPQQFVEAWTSSNKDRDTMRARCPLDFDKSGNDSATGGVRRVTRHPQLFSMGLLGFGTALRTPYWTEVVFFSWPLIFAMIGGAHMDYRYRHGIGKTMTAEEEAQTSLIPFAALLEGRQDWNALVEEMKVTNAGMAIIIALGIFVFRKPF